MHDLLRLRLTAAVDHRIIGITRKGTLREVSLHPCVKRIVHEQIHQHRADHSALGCTAHPRQSRFVCSLKRRSQPPLDIQQDPVRLDVPAHRLEQEAMIDRKRSIFGVLPSGDIDEEYRCPPIGGGHLCQTKTQS